MRRSVPPSYRDSSRTASYLPRSVLRGIHGTLDGGPRNKVQCPAIAEKVGRKGRRAGEAQKNNSQSRGRVLAVFAPASGWIVGGCGQLRWSSRWTGRIVDDRRRPAGRPTIVNCARRRVVAPSRRPRADRIVRRKYLWALTAERQPRLFSPHFCFLSTNRISTTGRGGEAKRAGRRLPLRRPIIPVVDTLRQRRRLAKGQRRSRVSSLLPYVNTCRRDGSMHSTVVYDDRKLYMCVCVYHSSSDARRRDVGIRELQLAVVVGGDVATPFARAEQRRRAVATRDGAAKQISVYCAEDGLNRHGGRGFVPVDGGDRSIDDRTGLKRESARECTPSLQCFQVQ